MQFIIYLRTSVVGKSVSQLVTSFTCWVGTTEVSEWVSSFLTAHQHILGSLVPDNDVEDMIKERRYNQGYLATIKYE